MLRGNPGPREGRVVLESLVYGKKSTREGVGMGVDQVLGPVEIGPTPRPKDRVVGKRTE